MRGEVGSDGGVVVFGMGSETMRRRRGALEEGDGGVMVAGGAGSPFVSVLALLVLDPSTSIDRDTGWIGVMLTVTAGEFLVRDPVTLVELLICLVDLGREDNGLGDGSAPVSMPSDTDGARLMLIMLIAESGFGASPPEAMRFPALFLIPADVAFNRIGASPQEAIRFPALFLMPADAAFNRRPPASRSLPSATDEAGPVGKLSAEPGSRLRIASDDADWAAVGS